MPHDLNDVIPVLRTHQSGGFADLQRESGILKLLDHLAALERPEIASLRRAARILGILFGESCKIPAAFQFFKNLFGFRFNLGIFGGIADLEQYMGRFHRFRVRLLIPFLKNFLIGHLDAGKHLCERDQQILSLPFLFCLVRGFVFFEVSAQIRFNRFHARFKILLF